MPELPDTPPPTPADPAKHGDRTHDEDGVDLTLIDEMLQLEPIERLRLNDRAVRAILELRRAFTGEQ